jgi:hypothetical protein
MNLSKQTVETLTDLVEIKLSCMEVWDKDDRRELKALEQARAELQKLLGEPHRSKASVHELRAA